MPTPGEHKTVQARILAYTEVALLGQFHHLHTDISGNGGELINNSKHIVIYCD